MNRKIGAGTGAVAGLRSLLRSLRTGGPDFSTAMEDQAMLLGTLLARQVASLPDRVPLSDVEFKVFSQFGDDGIVHYLTERILSSKTFIEFGVGDYMESNTRFLLMHKNWTGFVMDSSAANLGRIRAWPPLWKYDLTFREAFIDRENINELIARSGLPRDLGLLHIDLDGNDYWIWECIEVIDPVVVIMEYNSVFGPDRPISVPYDPKFQRLAAHPSGLYWGASLAAIHRLASAKGYAFVGCNSAGNNAYFVRRDSLGTRIAEVELADGYVLSKLRDSRDSDGLLTLIGGPMRLETIRGMPVINVATMSGELL